MSIGFDKREYTYYDSEDDSFSEEDGDHDERDYTKVSKCNVPNEWVDQLCIDIQSEAAHQSLEIFDKLDPYGLAEFLSEYTIDPYKSSS
ncbi:MAG TPA: hypothetical protein PKD85_06910 [Saprospiraceae bacterium]|nr:hypothetical protein [Saprospiraceae bacterium]